MYQRIPYSSIEEWLKERGKGIGGSDASCILGLNPYKTNVQLYNHKKGIEHFDNIDNAFTRYGHAVEEHIRGIFAATFPEMSVSHTDEIIARVDKPYLRASLDGEIEVLEDCEFSCYWKQNYAIGEKIGIPKPMELKKGMKGILEIKSTFILNSMSKEKWNNKIPDNYYCQCLHYLNVKDDTDFVIIPALLVWEDINNVKTCEIRYYGFMKNDHLDDCELLEKEETKFWTEYIEKNVEPPLLLYI